MGTDRRPERLERLLRRVAEVGFDALLVTHPANVRYLTGFTGSSALLLVSRALALLVTDSRYAAQAPAEVGGFVDVAVEASSIWGRLGRVLAAHPGQALAFERDHLSVAQAARLHELAHGRTDGASGLVEGLRLQKDPGEVEAIRQAAALALAAFETVLDRIRVGQTEREVAALLEAALRVRGSEWHPFPTIVAAGARSARPHARPTDQPIAPGDLVLLDFGAQLDGYCADLTRTVVVGQPASPRQREVYAAVRAAQQAAIAGMRPGDSGRAVDALAREVLASRGMGPAFAHSLGHGLGLEVHEDPRLSRTADAPVPAGAVVTVEPGAYFEDWGGIRLEDDVLLTPAGAELLSPGAPELVELA